jgi:hypothetical protein
LVGADGSGSDRLWRVASQPVSGEREVEALVANATLENLEVRLSEEVAWLAHIPSGQSWRIVLSYGPTPASAALADRPCALRWVQIPLRQLITATRRGAWQLPSVEVAPSVVPDGVRRSLSLVGVAEFDLQQVHQAAMTVEFGGSLPRGLSAGDLRTARRALIAQMLGRPDGERELCLLGKERKLFDLPLRMWSGESTVPARHREACGA